MSFIDYNFFPILFFLGWNILTTKQFSPNVYNNTSDFKTSPALSVFSLSSSMSQKTLQTDSKGEKKSDILQFLPGFQFLSDNQKSVGVLPTENKPLLFKSSKNNKDFNGFSSASFVKTPFNRILLDSRIYELIRGPATIKDLKITDSPRLFFTPGKKQASRFPFWTSHQKWEIPKRELAYYYPETKEAIKKNGYDSCNSLFQGSSFFTIGIDKKKSRFHLSFKRVASGSKRSNATGLNNINCIQKRRSKIRLLLRIPIQQIYSLNRFQIALCFSKILQPSQTRRRNSLEDQFLNGNREEKQTSQFPFKFFNEQKLPQFQDNTFTKSSQETSYVENYKMKKKDWYMKTQFFQHVAWNMKHKISDRFSNLEYLVYTTDLPVKNTNNFVTKPSTIASYQDKQHFFTNSDKSIKIAKEDLKTMPFVNKTKSDDISINSEKTKSVLLQEFSERPKKDSVLKTPTFDEALPVVSLQQKRWSETKNYLLKIYGGSWYFENLSFPYSIFNILPINPLNKQFFPGLTELGENKPLISKLSKSGKSLNSLFSASPVFDIKTGDASVFLKNKNTDALWDKNQTQYFIKDPFKCNYRALPNTHFNSSYSYKKDSFSGKLQTRLESDIGIYSLAHKLSSIGFRNGNSEIDIYPFKYNDSYRYNFQNMNLSNHRLKDFLSLSGLKNQTKDASVFSKENTDAEQDFISGQKIHFSNFRKFLDFQNPSFSKIYAPLFQPQGLNLLSFLYNSFFQIIPNSFINSQSIAFFDSSRETKKPSSHRFINFFLPNQIQPIINDYPHYLKDSPKIDKSFKALPSINESRELKTFNGFHHKLPINGIHTNLYPWITQNASDRWSSSNGLYSFLSNPSFLGSFDPTEPEYSNAHAEYKEGKRLFNREISIPFLSTQKRNAAVFENIQNTDASMALKKKFIPTTCLNDSPKKHPFLVSTTSQKEPLKNSNLQLHFTKKPSCIKKPSIFFSSFRHLPYFFISETLSTKNVVFPQTNLSLVPLFGGFPKGQAPPIVSKGRKRLQANSWDRIPSEKLEKKNIYTSSNFIIPQYSLFSNNVSSSAGRSQGSQEAPSEAMGPLATFRNPTHDQKKGVLEPWKGFLQHKSFSLKPLSLFIKKEVGYETSLFSKKTSKIWPKNKIKSSIRRTDFIPVQKNTWKVFPPLFQALTFRFVDLNLPRTLSSELLTRSTPKKENGQDFSGLLGLEYSNPRTRCLSEYDSDKQGSAYRFKRSQATSNEAMGQDPIDNQFLNKNRDACFLSPVKNKRSVSKFKDVPLNMDTSKFSKYFENTEVKKKPLNILSQTKKWNITQKKFFHFSIPFYFSDFFRFSASPFYDNKIEMRPYANDFDSKTQNKNNQFGTNSTLFINNQQNHENTGFYESAFPLTDFSRVDQSKQPWNNNQKLEKKNGRLLLNETPKFQNSKIIVYGEKPLLKNRTVHGPPLKNQKESISLPSYLKNITNQNYQNLCPNNLNEFYVVFWVLFNKTLFIYLSLHYLRKFISFLGTEYIRNLFKIFVTMKFIDGNILSIIKTFQDFNFQLNQQNVIDIKVNKQLKDIKRN